MPRSISSFLRLRPAVVARLALPLALLTACPGKAPQTNPAPVAPAPTAAPATEQTSELSARLELLTTRLEQARKKHHIPGMAVAVVKDDEVVFAEGFGYADVAARREATPQTLFAVGSTTKAFTSTLVAMMVDEGKLAWNDQISKHVPELQLKPRPKKEGDPPPEVTLRDVLCHRSGFTRMSLLWISGALTDDEVYARASEAEPWATYGEKFLYNNVTYASAGEAAARVAGTEWAQLLQARLLDPLGMKRTNVSTEQAQADPELATGYRWREITEEHEAVPMRALHSIAPAGAINSTVLDMAQWLRLQLGRGTYEGKTLVSTERIVDTWSPQIEVGGGIRYGLGWMLGDWQGHRVVEHGGNIDGFAAEVAMLPDDQIGFVLLTNISHSPLQRESMGIVWDSLLGELPSDQPGQTLDLSPYPGKYVANFATFDDVRFTVSAEGGKLFVDVPGQRKYELRPPDDEDRWAFALTDQIEVWFERDDQGRAQVLHMLQAGYDFEVPREGYTFPPEFTKEQVADKLGTYRSDKPKLEVAIVLEGGRLAADIKGQATFVLRKPDDQERWAFRAKADLAIGFNEGNKKAVESITLYEGDQDTILARIEGTGPPLPTVAQLLKRARAETFEKRLSTLGAVELTGKVRVPSSAVEGRFRLVFDAQRRHRVEVDFGRHGRNIDTYDGTTAWSVSTLGPATEHKGKYLRQAALGTALLVGDWTRDFASAQVEDRQGEGKEERIVVTLRTDELPPLTVQVDPKRGEVRSVRQLQLNEGVGAIPTETELSDVRRALGLRLPHRIRTQNANSGATILEIESVKKVEGDPTPLFARGQL